MKKKLKGLWPVMSRVLFGIFIRWFRRRAVYILVADSEGVRWTDLNGNKGPILTSSTLNIPIPRHDLPT